MNYCRICGTPLEENAKFCSKCGTPVTTRTLEKTERIGRQRKSLNPWAIAGIAVLATVVVVALIAIPLLLGGLLPLGQVIGSGNARTQTETVSDFTTVGVGNGFKVQLTQASDYKVIITADDNLFNYIQVTKTGSTLTIRLTPGFSYQSSTLKAEITMPDLQELQLSGGANGTAEGFVSSHDFHVELSGGSTLKMGGEANNLAAICSGGSKLDMSDFAVNNADVVFSGGSQGTINLSGTLNATLSGGSRLFYIGNPTLGDIVKSGGSSVSPK